MIQELRNWLALAICAGFLLFGVIRIVVGVLLLAQNAGSLDSSDLAGAVADTVQFMDRAADRALLPMGVASYLGYIVAMGVTLSAGALAAFWRRSWGFALIACYLALHGLLFVNFMTINPKVAYLGAGIVLLGLLWWLRGPIRR